jgi:drug/metabolite transporter (DMT)-like permease
VTTRRPRPAPSSSWTRSLRERPVAAGAAGAFVIAFSAILVRLAEVTPETAAVFRCVYALPALGLLAVLERRRFGPRPGRERRLGLAAGVLFAADLVLWHHAIEDVGAGLATVLGNLQVVLVAFLAWMLLGERPSARMAVAVPVVVCGAVLISGLLEQDAYGDEPARGVLFGVLTTIAYAGFLLVLRQTNADDRRPAGPLFDATASGAVTAAAAGALYGATNLVPSWPEHGWLLLLALSSQVVGWLLISVSLPRLPAALTSLLLLIQPVSSVALGALVLDERPSALQVTGVVVILAGVVYAARQSSAPPDVVGT